MLVICANKGYSGEDVLDGLMQQPHLHNTVNIFPCNYGLGQDLDSAKVGTSEKPKHVLVLAEKGKQVPKFIRSIPYYIQEPEDGKWEINLTILKSSKDLSGIQPEKGLDHKVVSAADGWTELPAHNIVLPFDTSIEDFGIQCFDDQARPTHREACVYLVLELRGIQCVIHAIGRRHGKEDVSCRNVLAFKSRGYQVHGFDDTTKYFHVRKSTPTRILGGSEEEPIGKKTTHAIGVNADSNVNHRD
jgi:hypothetical protein